MRFLHPFGDLKGVKIALRPPSGPLNGVYTLRKLKIVFLAFFSDFLRFSSIWGLFRFFGTNQ